MGKVKITKGLSAAEKAAAAEAEELRYASQAGLSLGQWRALDETAREKMRSVADKAAKEMGRIAKSHARRAYYAARSGMSVEEWQALVFKDRKAKAAAIRADDKAEAERKRAVAKVRAERQKAVSSPTARRPPKSPPAAGLPGSTRCSTITGLMASPSDKKWELFLQNGPYWNYMARYIQNRRIFPGRPDLVSEAVMNTCEKIGRIMVEKKYEYPEAGRGYFRKFLKVVAFRTALDLLKDIRRQEQIVVSETKADKVSEVDKIHDDITKSIARRKEWLKKTGEPKGLDSEIPAASDRDLDIYDKSEGFARTVGQAEKKPGKKTILVERLNDNPLFDDSASPDDSPAAREAAKIVWDEKVAKEDVGWINRLRIHVLYIALGYVLTDERVSPDRREMLRLRYGLGKTPGEIYRMPRFSAKKRNAFDVQMNHATEELRKEARSWWKLVAPDKNDFADETVMRFWRELGRRDDRGALANDLQDKANDIAGKIG